MASLSNPLNHPCKRNAFFASSYSNIRHHVVPNIPIPRDRDCRACGDTASMLGVCEDPIPNICNEEIISPPGKTVSEANQNVVDVKASIKYEDPFHNCIPRYPGWLWGLLNAEMFEPCTHHPGLRKNECNFFCFSCTPDLGRALCRHCLPSHDCPRSSRIFQIRRYMYQNVVHTEDLTEHYDLAGVQAYCINARRAVLLRPKPPPSTAIAAPAFANNCRGCAVPLRPDCTYCCLKCKVDVDFGVEPATPGPRRPPGPAKGTVEGGSAEVTLTFRSVECCRNSSEEGGSSLTGSKRRKICQPQRSHVL